MNRRICLSIVKRKQRIKFWTNLEELIQLLGGLMSINLQGDQENKPKK
jgi:hypothetical protein